MNTISFWPTVLDYFPRIQKKIPNVNQSSLTPINKNKNLFIKFRNAHTLENGEHKTRK